MSTVTSHTLLSRPARYSAGASSLRCLKPAVVSLPRVPAGKRTPLSLCHYVDPKSVDHPSNISPVALVHPERPPTSTALWKIKEDEKKVELTIFSMPEEATPLDFHVAVQGDVLVIRKDRQQWNPYDDISFHVRLLVPEMYDRKEIRAELERRNLVITVPKVPDLTDVSSGTTFYKKVNVEVN